MNSEILDVRSALRALPEFGVDLLSDTPGEDLPVVATYAGHVRETRSTYRFHGLERGSRPFVVVQFTLEGVGRIDTPTESQELRPGSALLAPVPSDHCYYLPADQPLWEFVYLTLEGGPLVRSLTSLQNRLGYCLLLEAGDPVWRKVLELLALLARTQSPDVFTVSSLTYGICMDLLALGRGVPNPGKMERFDQLKRFLQDHLSRDISVSEMADFVGLSRSYFSRVFELNEGVSPHSFLENLRMANARHLLRFRSLAVKEVAYFCGYYDVNYFCRLFRKHFDMTPGQYAKSSHLPTAAELARLRFPGEPLPADFVHQGSTRPY